jgi:hypothetical protein|tara:strand:+ start:71 stop:448 length:378 start_codon:yes stop_codon:yes gene_type:complete
MSWTKKDFSPEVAQRLAVVAREMRQLVWDGDGVPEWGTLFSEIEQQGMSVGGELARLMMEQAVEEQAQVKPPDKSLSCEDENATVTKTDQTSLETPAGAVHWDQPLARLKQQRRDFFPSGQSTGD